MNENGKYPWFTSGDLNAFFGLMLDNMTVLVMLSSILVGVFGFPVDFIFTHMIPGTALGVLIGDSVYSWMAIRLAKRTGRTDVTAMPLGLDTPSTIGIAFAVLGPVYLETHDPMVTWQVGMATMMFIGLVKLVLSFAGDWVRRMVPQAGLLGSIAGVGVALLGFLPLVKVFHIPVVGMISLGIILVTLVAKVNLPGRLPGAAVAVAAGTILYYLLGWGGGLGDSFQLPRLTTFGFTFPMPTLGFVEGLGRAVDYLPVAIPFGLLTIVGGINVTQSARVAGDDYKTRDILLTEAVATLAAGLTGGVAQTTPYIGHPAYKAMGGRVGYALFTGLFVGIGGMLGIVSFIVEALPEAAVAPILIYVGFEIMSQTFESVQKSHFPAITLALFPTLANLVQIQYGRILGGLNASASALPAGLAVDYQVIVFLGNGFILTAMLWGGFAAHLVDRKFFQAAVFLFICAVFSLFGVIHSVLPNGSLYLPWEIKTGLPLQISLSYAAVAALALLFQWQCRSTKGGII
jgi:adenine/guanine/hypoxanthine permease